MDDLNHLDTLAQIKKAYFSFRPSERKVADFILKNSDRVVSMSIVELSKEAGVSDATIVKTGQKLGYRGFKHLKIALATGMAVSRLRVYGDVEPGDDLFTIKEKIFKSHQTALRDTGSLMDPKTLEAAVEAILRADRIFIMGIGASGLVARDAQHKFLRIGLDALAFPDSHLQVSMSSLVTPRDVVIGISHRGITKEVLVSLQLANANGATTISITNSPGSPVDKAAKIRFYTVTNEGLLRGGAITSRVAQFSIVDTLFVAVAMRRVEASLDCLKETRAAVETLAKKR